jgi:hypothetical protein
LTERVLRADVVVLKVGMLMVLVVLVMLMMVVVLVVLLRAGGSVREESMRI